MVRLCPQDKVRLLTLALGGVGGTEVTGGAGSLSGGKAGTTLGRITLARLLVATRPSRMERPVQSRGEQPARREGVKEAGAQGAVLGGGGLGTGSAGSSRGRPDTREEGRDGCALWMRCGA